MPHLFSLVRDIKDGDCRSASIALRGSAVIPPGWYRLSGTIESRARGRFWLRCGQSQAQPIAFSDHAGTISGDSIIHLATETSRFMLEGSDDANSLVEPSLVLHPLGKVGALFAMLRARRDPAISGVSGGRYIRLLRALAILARRGVAPAAHRIHQDYSEALQRRERIRTGVPADNALLCVLYGWHAPILLEPDQLEARFDESGRAVWRTTGDDPKFVSAPLERPLAGGWYRVRVKMTVSEGRIIAPCLYLDQSQSAPATTQVALAEPDHCGMIDVLVVITNPVHRVRFDPTLRRATFGVADFRLRRVSRIVALYHMLVRSEPAQCGMRRRLASAWRFLADARSNGLSLAAATLMNRYRERNLFLRTSYQSWVERYDCTSDLRECGAWKPSSSEGVGPLISILLPVYDAPEQWLRRCLNSVLEQTYPKWELCVVNDASPSPHVREVLDQYVARDQRIKVVHRATNGHISEASNNALELASGAFVALLDHDDELRPHALERVALALAANPRLLFVYSDEDKLNEAGERFDPYFKPDWNPDLLKSQNYLCHLSVIATALVREVGGFRAGYEGSQDHDLFLRVTERLSADCIHHIPEILYHWRAIPGSTALQRTEKDYASIAGARAVADHLLRIGSRAIAEELPHGHYRVRWPIPAPAPKVCLIVPTRDRVELLQSCVESILDRTRYAHFEIIIVDNQSSEQETLEYFARLAVEPRVRVLAYNAPFNYSAINNFAVAHCDAEIIGLVNNDIEVIGEDWLEEMVGHAIREDIGAVGGMLYYPNDTIQHAGVLLGAWGVANHFYLNQPRGHGGHGGRALVAQNLSAVTAACLIVRRNVYEQVGGLNEDLKVAFNDVDFCLRLLEAGYRNVWTPFAELYHHESASRGADDTPEKVARFESEVGYMLDRWRPLLEDDPAYNPNLTLEGTNCELAFPPRERAARRVADCGRRGSSVVR